VGGPYDNSNTGAVWIYSRNVTVWTQQGNKLVGNGAVGSDVQGVSVALSADGSTAIVGGSHDNSSTGAAWIYSRSGDVWTQQGNKLVGTGAVGIAYGGSSVALSGDGNTAVVGGPYDNSSTGAAWVYTRSGGVDPTRQISWSAPARLDKPDRLSLRSPLTARRHRGFGDSRALGRRGSSAATGLSGPTGQ
jgi:lipocalin